MDRRKFLQSAASVVGASTLGAPFFLGCSSKSSSATGALPPVSGSDLSIEEERFVVLRSPQTYFAEPIDPDGDQLSNVVMVGDSLHLGANQDGSWNQLRAPRGLIRGDGSLVFDTALWPAGRYRFDLAIAKSGALASLAWLQKEKLTNSSLVRIDGHNPPKLNLAAAKETSTILAPLPSPEATVYFTGFGPAPTEAALPPGACQIVLPLGYSVTGNMQGTILLPTGATLAQDGPGAMGEVAELKGVWDSASRTWKAYSQAATCRLLSPLIAGVDQAFGRFNMRLSQVAFENTFLSTPGNPFLLDSTLVPDISSRFMASRPFSELVSQVRAGTVASSRNITFYDHPQWWVPGTPQSDAAFSFGGGVSVSWVISGQAIDFTLDDATYDFPLIPRPQNIRDYMRNLIVSVVAPAEAHGCIKTGFRLKARFSVPK